MFKTCLKTDQKLRTADIPVAAVCDENEANCNAGRLRAPPDVTSVRTEYGNF